MTIICQQLSKSFGDPPVQIIHPLELQVSDGEFVSISGMSGSGKSTLLYLMSTLDTPSSGQLLIDDVDPAAMSVDALHRFRGESIGFVFQFHYLLPELTALENVLLPARRWHRHQEKLPWALELLERFDIVSERDKRPSQLSGGQQQRVAIVRALMMRPRYLFADEPTGNLDSINSKVVMDFLKQASREWRMTLVLVTHEPEYAAMADREIFLRDGSIVEERLHSG